MSWTADPTTGYLDWIIESSIRSSKNCSVIAVADLSTNFGSFVINPEEMGNIGAFGVEQEILQVSDARDVTLHVFVPDPGFDAEVFDIVVEELQEI